MPADIFCSVFTFVHMKLIRRLTKLCWQVHVGNGSSGSYHREKAPEVCLQAVGYSEWDLANLKELLWFRSKLLFLCTSMALHRLVLADHILHDVQLHNIPALTPGPESATSVNIQFDLTCCYLTC